jgi:hypothetical protein
MEITVVKGIVPITKIKVFLIAFKKISSLNKEK